MIPPLNLDTARHKIQNTCVSMHSMLGGGWGSPSATEHERHHHYPGSVGSTPLACRGPLHLRWLKNGIGLNITICNYVTNPWVVTQSTLLNLALTTCNFSDTIISDHTKTLIGILPIKTSVLNIPSLIKNLVMARWADIWHLMFTR